MSSLLEMLVGEFQEKELPALIERNISIPAIPNKIKVAVGMRRTGKTWFLYQQILQLLKRGVPREQILYVNFEDERLLPLTSIKLGQLLDEFYVLYPDFHHKTCYFFLDEIQNIEGWPIVLRRWLDSRKVEIFITGSSAKLLSKEIATTLRGRSVSVEIGPFSFKEYLCAKKKTFPLKKGWGPAIRDSLQFEFRTYIQNGGFPETIPLSEENSRRLLQDYVNLVVYRDVIDRYQTTNHMLLKYLVKTLIKSSGSLFSANKFFNNVKSQGIKAGKNTVYDYLQYLEDAYLSYSVPIFSESLRKRNVNPKKIYTIDTGLIRANSLLNTQNDGPLFENVIYLDLRRKGYDVYYYKTQDDYEIDFIVRNSQGKLHAFQVCHDADDPKTMAREERALAQAEKELKIRGELITKSNYLDFIAAA